MIPVLAVSDTDAARALLTGRFGFQPAANGVLSLGDQRVRVVAAGKNPIGMIDLRLDHIALKTGDADVARVRFEARGARLSRNFTPDGPKEIRQFWEHGTRYVFFDGPEGWPLEFVARNGVEPNTVSVGHDHFGIRTQQLDAMEANLASMGAKRIAEHRLGDGGNPVTIRFLRLGDAVFELFDDPPVAEPQSGHGWVGLMPE